MIQGREVFFGIQSPPFVFYNNILMRLSVFRVCSAVIHLWNSLWHLARFFISDERFRLFLYTTKPSKVDDSTDRLAAEIVCRAPLRFDCNKVKTKPQFPFNGRTNLDMSTLFNSYRPNETISNIGSSRVAFTINNYKENLLKTLLCSFKRQLCRDIFSVF